ncbi:hypothetical protein I305_05783 [Cryptococcus gattii E566]|uniref:Zn(2)-C6 fungal-type domain-containing protein n=2 Tax=Cryptococcus gattii TaxID=37769 RepID=E6RAB6_CRYGW|nr:Hypothetical protein CGB_H0600W [Cryptococcus gattii WM276]ADV23748.1 Hypothetical protein CGB_H0600W [Cryptococcus gattii WM276]KIR81611.1 hypothetical protein I306_01315 [Cryptococcus gattii EJB2]KIY31819.1 hypothetical protein I305_05783 [Cryptococcus gattii E566]
MSPPPTRPRQSSESEPSNVNKRARITRHACERCRSGKKKCDGQLPCSACLLSKKGQYQSPIMFPSIASSSESYERQSRYNSPSRQRTTENDVSVNDMSMVTAVGPEIALEVPEPDQDRDGGREVHSHNREHTLARIAHVMANGTVSRYPSPGVTILSPADGRPIVSSETDISTKGDLLDRLHRHLTVVFSLRSFPKGHLGEELKDENDNNRGADELFFLPSCEDGKAYIRCYFEHASSILYLDRRNIEQLTDDFYASNGSLSQKDDVALLLLLMAIGCLWTPSWTGADPQTMTQKALQLLRAVQRRLETLSISQPRLRMVQVHLALCHLYLGMSHFRSAWLAFGTAARLSQLLRLHRKSPDGTPQELDEPRRQAFWSGYMMDRYLSLVLGCPVIYDERDITQRFPSYPNSGDNSVNTKDEGQRLAGSIAHIKLSQILGHALRKLQSPGELSDLERSLAVQSLNQELDRWLAETPRFFHPDGPDACDLGPFASIPPFFQRQQQIVRSAYHFINLFIHRSFLLDQFINRIPASQPLAPLTVMSPEVTVCVESAISIAKSVSKMRDSPGAKGTFWNSAYFCFASLTVLLVYLMVYEDAPRRAEIENMIEAAMEGHIQLTGSTKREREQILEVKEPEMSGSRTQYIPPPWPCMEDPFVGSAPNWDPLWQNTLDMLGLDMSMGMGLPLGTSTIVEGRVTTAPDSGAFGFL